MAALSLPPGLGIDARNLAARESISIALSTYSTLAVDRQARVRENHLQLLALLHLVGVELAHAPRTQRCSQRRICINSSVES